MNKKVLILSGSPRKGGYKEICGDIVFAISRYTLKSTIYGAVSTTLLYQTEYYANINPR